MKSIAFCPCFRNVSVSILCRYCSLSPLPLSAKLSISTFFSSALAHNVNVTEHTIVSQLFLSLCVIKTRMRYVFFIFLVFSCFNFVNCFRFCLFGYYPRNTNHFHMISSVVLILDALTQLKSIPIDGWFLYAPHSYSHWHI